MRLNLSRASTDTTLSMVAGIAMALIAFTGLVHLLDAPDAFEEAAYKGVLFVANAVGAAVAAYGIYKHERWGWMLGLVISAGSVLAYVASRTVGMPLIPAEPDAWFEHLGVLSMAAELAFLAVGVWVINRKTA